MIWAFHRRIVVHDRWEKRYWQIEVEYEPPAGCLRAAKQPEITPEELLRLALAHSRRQLSGGRIAQQFWAG